MVDLKNIAEVYVHDENGEKTHNFITVTSAKESYFIRLKVGESGEVLVSGQALLRAVENGMNVGN